MLEITDIRQCWERVRPGLEAIARKCDAEWRPEDVYAKCLAGEWTLLTIPDADVFVVVCQYPHPYRPGRVLFVEAAWHRGGADPFETYEPQLFEMARRIGAIYVEFRSPRRGFERRGWVPAEVIYRKEVCDG